MDVNPYESPREYAQLPSPVPTKRRSRVIPMLTGTAVGAAAGIAVFVVWADHPGFVLSPCLGAALGFCVGLLCGDLA